MKFIEGCVANLATNRLGFTYVKAIYSYCISPFFSCNLWEVVVLAFKQFNTVESQQLGKKKNSLNLQGSNYYNQLNIPFASLPILLIIH